jgi:aerobic carbon-monoxide dehydrogenase medium subunit
MKPAPFVYHAPNTVPEVLHLLATLDNARVIAGGQSLMPMLNFRVAMPDHLIDLGRVKELCGISLTDAGLTIGATTTQRTIEHSELVATHCPLLAKGLSHVGHQTTRNRGTIGGSLSHLDPTAELALVSRVLEPAMHCASERGVRCIPFNEFAVDQLTTCLEPDEILVRLDYPMLDSDTAVGFAEFARRPGDFAIVAVAVMVTFNDAGRVHDIRLAASGIESLPVRLTAAEEALNGQHWTTDLVAGAADIAGRVPAVGDHNNPPEYRQHLARALTRRALLQAGENRKALHG